MAMGMMQQGQPSQYFQQGQPQQQGGGQDLMQALASLQPDQLLQVVQQIVSMMQPEQQVQIMAMLSGGQQPQQQC